MKKFLIFISIVILLCIACVTFMCIKTEKDYDMKYKQILYGNKKGKDMSYCNTRASIGIEDYTSCLRRMEENY